MKNLSSYINKRYLVAGMSLIYLFAFSSPVFAATDPYKALQWPFYDPGCGSTADTTPVSDAHTDLNYPTTLQDTAIIKAIIDYIRGAFPKSTFLSNPAGADVTITSLVASAKKNNVSPFIVVAIAQKESQLGDPVDFNVSHGNNSFGRTAAPGQPSFQGSHTWYKWESIKASVDYTDPSNRGQKAGDEVSFLRSVYGDTIDSGDLTQMISRYAPQSDGNDTAGYITQVQAMLDKLTKASGGAGTDISSTGNSTDSTGSCACPASSSTAANTDVAAGIGKGMTANAQKKFKDILAGAGGKFKVAPEFIASFYYAENSRTDDSTNNADSAQPPPVTGNGKWREPAPPYGTGAAYDRNGFTASGPFQFIDSTWASFKVDGNGDGKADVNDLADATYGAAKYLASNGGVVGASDKKLRDAAFLYNHSSTYVDSVMNTYKYLKNGSTTTASASGTTTDCSSASSTDTTGYKNPLRDVKNLVPERDDQGVDYAGSGPIYAIGTGMINYIKYFADSGWPPKPAGTFINYTLKGGKADGKSVYVAENCAPPKVKLVVGDTVHNDTILCNLIDASPHMEIGWAKPGQGEAYAHNIYTEGDLTAYGLNFSQFLESLGAPPGTTFNGPVVGTLESGWPQWK